MVNTTVEKPVKQALIEAKLDTIYERLARLKGRPTVFWNTVGKGKTLCMVYFSWWFKELMHLPIITVGTQMSFTDRFGKKAELTTADFGEQLKIVTALSKVLKPNMSEREIEHYINKAKEKLGFVLYNCVVNIDEGRKWMWRRDSMTNKNKSFAEYLMLSRHLKITNLISFPDWKDADIVAAQQIKWRCKVDSDQIDPNVPPTAIYCEFRGDYPWNYEIPARDYFKYYVSENLIGFSETALNLSSFGV